MAWLLVVNHPKRWNLSLPDIEIVSASEYLASSRFADMKRLRVLNLCRSYAYQTQGYYVSLLAEARGHRPMPSLTTLQDFKSPSILRALSSDLDRQVQRAFKSLQSERFTLSIYFGRNLAKRYDPLSRSLYNLFPAPLMRAQFVRRDGRWDLENLSPLASSGIPENHREFVFDAARQFLKKRPMVTRPKACYRYDLAMLVDPDEALPPSDEVALKRFEKAGERAGIRISRITKDDYSELAEYDGLLIRTTTSVNHYTYRFARKAEAEGLVVIDDSQSILRCGNKVYLREALKRLMVAMPDTWIVHRENLSQLPNLLAFPFVLKQPDSAFSQGVVKVVDIESYHRAVEPLLEESELLIAQQFVPTDFDWRIGVLDGGPLYACKYFMARNHWQIYNHSAKRKGAQSGDAATLSLEDVPAYVIETACKASAVMGNGLYGVDIKEIDGKAVVIEVNDNPSIDAGIEDEVLGDGLYNSIIQYFLKGFEKRAHGADNSTTPSSRA